MHDEQIFLEISNKLQNNEISQVQDIIQELDQVMLAEFFETASKEVRCIFIRKYLKACPEIIPELESDLILEIYDVLSGEQFAKIIKIFSVDRLVDILKDLDDEKIKDIISFLPSRVSDVLREILSYPEESAGRLIHKNFIVIPQNWTVEQVIQLIKSYTELPKDLSEIFVINAKYKPVGSIKLGDLFRSKSTSKICEIMRADIKIIESGRDQEEVARLFRDYSLIAAPVVNSSGEVIGVISLDDVVDVISEEAEEDILHVAKLSESDIRSSIITTMFNRLKWLIITFISINISSYIIGFFSKTLESHIELSILMPIVAAMGGNAGIQASTVSLRAIVSKQLTDINATRLFMKELMVGFFNGLVMSALMFAVIFIRFHDVKIEFTFLCAVTTVFALATSIGSAIPLIVEKLGGDSTLSSSIITSSFTDILSFLVLLSIARIILL